MQLRVWSALFAAVLMICMAGPTSSAGSPRSSVVSAPLAQVSPGDNDGDGLPDDLDPDDDNDGITDQNDPAPHDASVPGAIVPLTPDPNAHDQDSDGDEIANDIDPDDNNDGVVDDGTAPTTVPPQAISESAPQPANTPKSPPVVTALPATGSGDEQASMVLPLVAIMSLAMLLASVGIVTAPSTK